mmetsp:Transcript_11125/g.34107  ORF Transcript_11125/g.34107 Transcript_11125/m.34107 type:complete len:517 (-) Transcript_11125:304-1854(-)
MDYDDYDDDDGPETLVKQNSSFGKLSADSWVTVESQYDAPDTLLFPQVADVEEREVGSKGPKVNTMSGLSAVEDKTVLDCLVTTLAGTRVQRKKFLLRPTEKWIWLGEDLATLRWKSRRRPDYVEKISLPRTKKIRCDNTELSIETDNKKKVAFQFATEKEVRVWITGISCLVPKVTKVVVNGQEMVNRAAYDPMKDSWRGKLVSERKRVNEYILLGGIGKGSFGKVKLALSKEDKRFYALKIINQGAKKCGFTNEDITREEHAILRMLKHPNIVKHRDVLYEEETDRVLYVVEYMARGVVLDSSKLEGVKPLGENGVREIMRDVVPALQYLHCQRVIHRDIKPDNLLRAGDGTVKLGDLGEARFYNVKSPDNRGKPAAPGTPAFIAPELCMSEKSPRAPSEGYASDVWSLGATIFYMIYGRAPFLAKTVFEIYDAICSQKLTFPDQPKVSRDLKSLLERMLAKEPRSRARLEEVMQHSWFHGSIRQKAELTLNEVTKEDIRNAIKRAKFVNPKHS